MFKNLLLAAVLITVVPAVVATTEEETTRNVDAQVQAPEELLRSVDLTAAATEAADAAE